MTDKIIINNVDVSGCVSFDKNNGYNICCYDDTREDKIPFANFCQENPNCDYKRLVRKTEECEKLEERLSKYKQALEEIKKLSDELDDRLQGYHYEWALNRQIQEILQKCEGLNDITK